MLAVDSDEPDQDDDTLPTRLMHELIGGSCALCQQAYSATEAVFSIALGLKNSPRCTKCLALGLNKSIAELRADLMNYINRRECYRKALQEAEHLDGECPRPDFTRPGTTTSTEIPEPPQSSTFWDAGDMGCGELVMALRMRLRQLSPETALEVRATDPAAPEDIPAWCRLTGHQLVSMNHPRYVILSRKGQ